MSSSTPGQNGLLEDLFSYNNLVHAIAGATGSVVGMSTFYPLDIVRTRFQGTWLFWFSAVNDILNHDHFQEKVIVIFGLWIYGWCVPDDICLLWQINEDNLIILLQRYIIDKKLELVKIVGSVNLLNIFWFFIFFLPIQRTKNWKQLDHSKLWRNWLTKKECKDSSSHFA